MLEFAWFFVLAAGRLNYSSRDMKILMAALLLGGAWAVIDSFHAWAFNEKVYPEFRSVGHVNHSGMYSLIPLAVGIATFTGRVWWLKIIGACAIATTLAYLPPSRSLVSGITIVAYFRAFLPLAISRRAAPSDQMSAPAAVLIATGFLMARLGSTTTMNEHGQAGMGIIAILWGYLRSSDAPLPKP